MDLILNGYLQAFKEDFELDVADDELFEHFLNYCICSFAYGGSIPDPRTFHAGQAPGIDGVIVIVNDNLVFEPEEVQDLAKNRLDAQFIFVQAKRSANFDQGDLLKFGHAVKAFFHYTDPAGVHKDLERHFRLKQAIYQNVAKMEGPPSCTLAYGCAGVWTNTPALADTAAGMVSELRQTGLVDDTRFVPLGAEGIKERWKAISNRVSKSLLLESFSPMPKITHIEQAYLAVASCREYMNLIATEDGELMRSVFYDNVRDFQGSNPVNLEISETLEGTKEDRDKFVILNNGITIVATSVKPVGKEFRLENFQVVNGCQTSHVLWLNRHHLTGDEYVTLKLIASSNPEVTIRVIKATNSQTEVKREAFETLKPFHKELEEFYAHADVNAERLYYERRAKQYDGLGGAKKTKIISLGTQINAFVSMFLGEPHSTVRYYGEILEVYAGRIFNPSHEPYAYYIASKLYSRIERLFAIKQIHPRYRPFKYHLLLLVWTQWRRANDVTGTFERSRKNALQFAKFHQFLHEIDAVSKAIQPLLAMIDEVREEHRTGYLDAARLRSVTLSLLKRLGAAPQAEPSAAPFRKSGVVKRFGSRLFGFILADDGAEYYVSIADVKTPGTYWLTEGTNVSFVPTRSIRGPIARSVEIVDS